MPPGRDRTWSPRRRNPRHLCRGGRQATACAEREILEQYRPAQLNEQQLQHILHDMVQALQERTPKQMGVIMKRLKETYEGQYDGALASKLIKELLA